MSTGQLFYDPYPKPLSTTGGALPGAYYNFYLSGTTTPAPVYQNGALTTPYPAIALPFIVGNQIYNAVQADGSGLFQPIFLNPILVYRVQLYSSTGTLIEDVDPYIPQMPSVGNGQIILNAQGEMTIGPALAGGNGVTLTVVARSGVQALQLTGAGAGTAAVIANLTALVGSQTATFSATNKPGAAGTGPAKWLPIQCDGGTYYLPLWT
jgi:hypothetical protein